MPRRLRVYQSLWAMEMRRPGVPELSLDECFERVAAAGYHGLALDLSVTGLETAQRCAPLYRKHGLECLINAFPRSLDALAPVLVAARELGATLVNVIGQVMPLTVPEAVPIVERWMSEARQAGVPIHFETHRNGLLNDLFSTLQLIDLVPEMPLCADLSHFLIDREFPYPIDAANEELIERILRRSRSFQGRVASREQIQLQIDFPQHRRWVDVFLRWWTKGFTYWLASAGPDEDLIFLCELGPREYAMTGPDGEEMSDRWAEAMTMKRWVEEIWHGLQSAGSAAPTAWIVTPP